MPRKPRLHVPGGLYHVILREYRFEVSLEETQILGFMHHFQSANLVAPLVDIDDGFCDHVHMGLVYERGAEF